MNFYFAVRPKRAAPPVPIRKVALFSSLTDHDHKPALGRAVGSGSGVSSGGGGSGGGSGVITGGGARGSNCGAVGVGVGRTSTTMRRLAVGSGAIGAPAGSAVGMTGGPGTTICGDLWTMTLE